MIFSTISKIQLWLDLPLASSDRQNNESSQPPVIAAECPLPLLAAVAEVVDPLLVRPVAVAEVVDPLLVRPAVVAVQVAACLYRHTAYNYVVGSRIERMLDEYHTSMSPSALG
jgi:hypothetical protein